MARPPESKSDGRPASTPAAFPSAEQYAIAMVTACGLTGDNPVELAQGAFGIKARHLTLDALRIVFPDAKLAQMAKSLAYSTPEKAAGLLGTSRKAPWWSEIYVDEIVGALVAANYGDQAK